MACLCCTVSRARAGKTPILKNPLEQICLVESSAVMKTRVSVLSNRRATSHMGLWALDVWPVWLRNWSVYFIEFLLNSSLNNCMWPAAPELGSRDPEASSLTCVAPGLGWPKGWTQLALSTGASAPGLWTLPVAWASGGSAAGSESRHPRRDSEHSERTLGKQPPNSTGWTNHKTAEI